uniref:Transmembrane channel-like protein n=1 Tax=Buteo japonicus TaxID=224669 RepID=A0A8C0BX02_9AVES
MFNIISFLILLVFVVALQAAYPPASTSPQSFTGLELLTGAVSTASTPVPAHPWSYRVGSSAGDLAVKVFCAWDFKVIQRRSVKLQCENICTQLKELLADQQSRSRSLSLCQRLGHSAVLLLAWALSLSTVLGCVLAVHYFSEHISERQQEAILLVLPFMVSLLNMLMPHLYNLLATWEKQDSPVAQVYVAICRNLILKMVVLGLLCYQWLSRRVVCSTEECWETCVGQDLYRFVVMDFIFTLLDTLFGELVWR